MTKGSLTSASNCDHGAGDRNRNKLAVAAVAADYSFVSGVAVFVVLLKLSGNDIFVLLAHGCFVLIGSLAGRIVVVINCAGCQGWSDEVRRQFLRYFRGARIRFFLSWFGHVSLYSGMQWQEVAGQQRNGRGVRSGGWAYFNKGLFGVTRDS